MITGQRLIGAERRFPIGNRLLGEGMEIAGELTEGLLKAGIPMLVASEMLRTLRCRFAQLKSLASEAGRRRMIGKGDKTPAFYGKVAQAITNLIAL